MEKRQGLTYRSQILPLYRPDEVKRPFVMVRVTIDKGSLYIQSQEKFLALLGKASRLKVEYDLKVIWVNDMLDDSDGQVRNCFVLMAPEKSFILQADSHRSKIEWIQTTAIAISQALRFRGSYKPSSWTHLDDLQRWLVTREVEYCFQYREPYKGAVYYGKWTSAMPHICGTLRWPHGDTYEGEFQFGKFHGTGTMTWKSDPLHSSYVGEWNGGVMEGHGQMRYFNHDVYTGWWHMGKRQGHGRMEYRGTSSLYIGSWKDDHRNGYGVFEDGQKNEKYIGMWSDDKYDGPGILITAQQTLYTCNFVAGAMKSLNELEAIPHDLKWDPLFQCCLVIIEQNNSKLPPPTATERGGCSTAQERLHQLLQRTNSCPELDEESELGEEDDDKEASSLKDGHLCEKCHNYVDLEQDCITCKVQAWKSTKHPIGTLIDTLTKCFMETYRGLGTHKYLLPYATAELNSLVFRLHETIRKYCPDVIAQGGAFPSFHGRRTSVFEPAPKHKAIRRTVSADIRDSQLDPSWLYPVVLPLLYPTLLGLYRTSYTEEDKKLDTITERLDTKTEEDLASLFNIHQEYELWTIINDNGARGFASAFAKAVACFQMISNYSTPFEKLLCIQTVCDEISKVNEKFQSDPGLVRRGGKNISAGLLAQVVVKARVKNMESELHYIHDFTGKTLLSTKYSNVATLLQEALQLMKEAQLP